MNAGCRLRRLGRVGRWILLADVCCTIGLILSQTFVRLAPSHPLAVGETLFVLCTFVAIVFSVLYWLIGLIVPCLALERQSRFIHAGEFPVAGADHRSPVDSGNELERGW